MTRIGISAVLRDEEKNLSQFFYSLESLENCEEVASVSYSFYENDSSDGTPVQLIQWLCGRHYVFKSEKRGWPRFKGKDNRRTQLLARARNTSLLNLMQNQLDYVVIVDVDISIELKHYLGLIHMLRDNDNAVMACASSVQPRQAIDTGNPTSYYDSWALIDRFGRPAIAGLEIPFLSKDDRESWLRGDPVSVQSAFGGLAVVKASAIRQQKALWDGRSGCEHWQFCKSLLRAGEILVSPNLKPSADSGRDGHPFNPQYVESVKNLLQNEGIYST